MAIKLLDSTWKINRRERNALIKIGRSFHTKTRFNVNRICFTEQTYDFALCNNGSFFDYSFLSWFSNRFTFFSICSGISDLLARCQEVGSRFRHRTGCPVGNFLLFGHQRSCLPVAARLVGNSLIQSLQNRLASYPKDIWWTSVQVSTHYIY